MEEPTSQGLYTQEEHEFRRTVRALRAEWWKIFLLSFATGVIALLYSMTMKNLFEATATVVPVAEDRNPNISMGLGALASSFGLSLGNATKVEDLEALFQSRELTVRVFREHDLWAIISPDAFDPDTGKIRTGWRERLFGKEQETKTPGDWDAVRAAEDMLDVSVNRKLGTVTISFESRSAEGSTKIVSYYLEEAKNRLQEKALDRATQNKKFLRDQVDKTVDPIIKERLYSLYSQEVEKEMMALNREQFGFTYLDSPMVPDRKSRPRRARIAMGATIGSFPAWCLYFGLRQRRQVSREDPPGES